MNDRERQRVLCDAAIKIKEKIDSAVSELRNRRRGPPRVPDSVKAHYAPIILSEGDDNLHWVRDLSVTLSPEEALSTWNDNIGMILNGEKFQPMFDFRGADTIKFALERYTDKHQRAAIFAWFLSNSSGLESFMDDHSILIKAMGTEFGIRDRVIISDFCPPTKLNIVGPINEVLAKPGKARRVRNKLFSKYYLWSYYVDTSGALAQRLCTIWELANWHQFKTWFTECGTFTDDTLKKLEELVFKDSDPVLGLYQLLVPQWMSARDFNKNVYQVSRRSLEPSLSARVRLMNKVVNLPFHPNH